MDSINLAYSDYGTSAGEAAFMAIAYLLIFLFSIAGYLIGSFLLMKIFERAGVEGKWRAWVPVYNYMIFVKLGDITPWALLALLVGMAIPIVNFLAIPAYIALLIMASVRVNAKFGREWPILLLFFLNTVGMWIWLGILAFSSNRWNPAAASPSPWGNSFLADKTVWNGIPVQPAQQGVVANAAPQGYGAPQGYAAPPAGSTPPAPPATGTTPPPPAPPTTGTTPPPPAPPAGPQV